MLNPTPIEKHLCKICEFKTRKLKKYKAHVQSHQEKGHLICLICDFVTLKQKRFEKHMKTHETTPECELNSGKRKNVASETVTSQNNSFSSNSSLFEEKRKVAKKSETVTQPAKRATEKDPPKHKRLKVNHNFNNNPELQQESNKWPIIQPSPQLESLTTKTFLNHNPSTKKKLTNMLAIKSEEESSVGPTEAISSTNAHKMIEANEVSRSVLQVKVEQYNKYSCSVCDFVTKKKRKYKDHVEFHEKEEQLFWSLCYFVTLSNKRFNKHLSTHENGPSDDNDSEIQKSSFSQVPLMPQETLSDASSSFLNSQNLPLKVCNEEAVDESVAGVQLSEPDVKKRMPKNGETFIKNSDDNKMHYCSMCEYKTDKSSNLTRHDQVHTGKRTFSCTYSECNYSFANKHNLKRHLVVRHSDVKPHSCKLCGEAFKTKYLLNSHVINHKGKREHHCLYKNCEYSSTQASHLKIHMRTHTKEKAHHCYFKGCEFSCSEGSTLATHIRTHTGETPYPCNFKGCNYSATHSSNLKTHLLTHTHTKDKAFRCDFKDCKFSSAQSGDLRAHMLRHLPQKSHSCSSLASFPCNFCKKSFATEMNMLNHLRYHTGQKLPR